MASYFSTPFGFDFYVDNGKQLPLWKDVPHFTYWLLPLVAGIPLIVRALPKHPPARRRGAAWLALGLRCAWHGPWLPVLIILDTQLCFFSLAQAVTISDK